MQLCSPVLRSPVAIVRGVFLMISLMAGAASASAQPLPKPTSDLQAVSCPGAEGRIAISGADADDLLAVCEGFSRAAGFFAGMGYVTEKPIRIFFKTDVRLPEVDSTGTPTRGFRVVGMYDAASNDVHMTKLNAPWLRQRPYFGLPHERELLVSVLTHEITHALSKAFYRYERKANGPKAQEEYIAYAAQMATMKPATRERILKRYPQDKYNFSSDNTINDMVHGFKPHDFGVMSYRHFMQTGNGKAFMERIYSGDFQPVDISDLH